MNTVQLLGNIVRDPDLKYAAGSGTAVSRFTVAVKRQFKKDESDFINCVSFGKQAEVIAQYFQKGDKIAVVGHILTGSYEKDGKKVYITDIIVDAFDFVNSKGSSNNSNEDYTFVPNTDNDLPF